MIELKRIYIFNLKNMVNRVGKGGLDSRENLRKEAEALGVGKTFDGEMKQALGVSDLLAQKTQAQADATRIAELQQIIANYDGDLGKILGAGLGMTVAPDSIDEVASRFEYTKEDAQKYLDELNRKYPIKEVFGDYYGNFLRGESEHILQSSFVGDTTLENSFYQMLQLSLKAGKWVSSLTPRWSMDYIRNHPKGDRKLESILNFNAFGFFDAYPEAHRFLEDYEKIVYNVNLLSMFKRTKKLFQMFFEMGKIVKNMDEWSKGVFLNKVGKIAKKETDYEFELQTGIFPKEHFIQWLMKRLGTSVAQKG